jgi:CheY-like chemotaxis protein
MKNHFKKNILVVEDEDINYFFICMMLVDSQANVFRAINGLDAINLVIEKPNIDLVIMDIQLPVMNGWDAIIQIKKNNIRLPIIVQTAYAHKENRCNELGCDGFIAKPYSPGELLKLVNKFIED